MASGEGDADADVPLLGSGRGPAGPVRDEFLLESRLERGGVDMARGGVSILDRRPGPSDGLRGPRGPTIPGWVVRKSEIGVWLWNCGWEWVWDCGWEWFWDGGKLCEWFGVWLGVRI